MGDGRANARLTDLLTLLFFCVLCVCSPLGVTPLLGVVVGALNAALAAADVFGAFVMAVLVKVPAAAWDLSPTVNEVMRGDGDAF